MMKTMLTMTDRSPARQMELGLPPSSTWHRQGRRQRRLPGAHWWFQQMRQAASGKNAETPAATPE